MIFSGMELTVRVGDDDSRLKCFSFRNFVKIIVKNCNAKYHINCLSSLKNSIKFLIAAANCGLIDLY